MREREKMIDRQRDRWMDVEGYMVSSGHLSLPCSGIPEDNDDFVSPWDSFRGMSFVQHIAKLAEAEHEQREDERKDGDTDKDVEALNRLQRISHRTEYLSKQMLPSLAALRILLRTTPEDQVESILELAIKESEVRERERD